MVKVLGWQPFDHQLEPYFCAFMAVPCGVAWDAVPELMVPISFYSRMWFFVRFLSLQEWGPSTLLMMAQEEGTSQALSSCLTQFSLSFPMKGPAQLASVLSCIWQWFEAPK
jgi:hypothetical protein